MEGNPLCLVIGGALSFIVSALKSVPLVKDHPLAMTIILNGLAAVLHAGVFSQVSQTAVMVGLCFLTQLGASVGTYEVVSKQLKKIANRG